MSISSWMWLFETEYAYKPVDVIIWLIWVLARGCDYLANMSIAPQIGKKIECDKDMNPENDEDEKMMNINIKI